MGSAQLDRVVSQDMIQLLSHMLADNYVLYVKTQNFHWNIVDSRFYSLHVLFEEQYKDLAEAADELAERIRMIQGKAPATMAEFLKLASLKEPEQSLDGDQMITELMRDNQEIAGKLRACIAKAGEMGDDGTVDLLTARLRKHEKAAWMLQSHL
ncbi:MAG: DNA starvation/stationary phase protection protein [Parachlamydiaceae bacterium]|nr:DNA starvation/stationary phase protection protein [Parachlamydiaceae bacterium]